MTSQALQSPNQIRTSFSRALSNMYREEVPQYGTLMELVADVNRTCLERDPVLREQLTVTGELERLDEERHGAIRLGTAEELATMRRLFAVMGMQPVSYYDLAPAGIPVHSTAFRAVNSEDLSVSPFRVFCSLLRLELIGNEVLRQEAAEILARRNIFTPGVMKLIEKAESQGGLNAADAEQFVAEALETFRWHSTATVTSQQYKALHDQHRLIADVVAFRGPHINHLTPRTLDIDEVQRRMPERGIEPKAVIEGPPARKCPILLRQTSFKALEEAVQFSDQEGSQAGSHTARFGEIEQRGCALTAKGRDLYDKLLNASRQALAEQPDRKGDTGYYYENLSRHFNEFPDDWATLHKEGLAFFRYSPTEQGLQKAGQYPEGVSVEQLLEAGDLRLDPIVYEDFLPVSAAGIFQSNLGENGTGNYDAKSSQSQFESSLGCKVIDEQKLYEAQRDESLTQSLQQLKIASAKL